MNTFETEDVRQHRAALAARDQIVRTVGCPRCGQIAGTACVGTDDDTRHAGTFLEFHHVQRLEAAAQLV